MPRMHAIDVLQALGVKLELDWGGALVVSYPLVPIDNADLAKIIEGQRELFEQELRFRRKRLLKQFVGGPLNGKRHDFFVWTAHQLKCVRVSRAKWAVYQAGERPFDDARLHFLGYAASQQKGRRGKLLPKRAEGKS